MRSSTLLGVMAVALVLSTGCGSDDGSNPGATGGGAGAAGAAGAGGGAGAAGAGGGPLALEPGEVAELEIAGAEAQVTLATPTGDEQFVLVLASMQLDASDAQFDYSLSFEPAAEGGAATLVSGCSLDSSAWSAQPLPTETPPSGIGPQVGDERSLSVALPVGSETIQAKAVAVGERTVVWADITPAHPAVLDSAFVQAFLADFENIILPRARTIFGVESDLDDDGRIGLVFSPLTYETAVAFFISCDLKMSLGCPPGNQGEYLYLTPPGDIPKPYDTPNAIKEILSHELAHLIQYNRKVLMNGIAGVNESAYMTEGVGALGQDVLGYQAGNLYVTLAGLDGVNTASMGETLVNTVQYAPQPRDGVLRGGAYLFVRWFYDRAGGDLANPDGSITSKGGPALLRTLLDSKQSIADTLPVATGSSKADLSIDFWTALAMSNRDVQGDASPANGCFAYLPTVSDPVTGRQRGANLFASFHGQQMAGPKLQPADGADGKLLAGGAELVKLEAAPDASELSIGISVQADALPRVRIGRIR
jgi:hypothetical protein